MTTNQDIMTYLKANQETRAREKEEEKKLRSEERKEDMEMISEMIKKGIKSEVQTAIKPLEDRLEAQEKVNKDLYKRLKVLQDELNDFKKGNSDTKTLAYPELPGPRSHLDEGGSRGIYTPGNFESAVGQEDSTVRKQSICSRARKVIGFSPIEPRMLDMQMNSYGAKDMQEAMLLEVKSYLKCELKIPPSTIQTLDFVRIFPPAKQDWKVLYVEFGHEQQVETIFSYTKNILKKDHRVLRWVPKQMYERFRAVENLAYNLRQEKGLKTRVKIGITDFILSTRDPKLPYNSYWIHHVLPDNLPEVVLDQVDPAPVQNSLTGGDKD